MNHTKTWVVASLVLAFASALALTSPLSAAARTTVAVAPLSTTSGPEYQWIGPALATALSLRVHQQPELNGLSLRQVNAAMRHDNIAGDQLLSLDTAVELGRQLGATVMVVGSYDAAWPDIEILIKLVDPQKKKLITSQTIGGGIDDLLALEARLAETLAKGLGAKKPDITPGAFGTSNLRAWRATTLALEIINWQSLSPRAADPNAPLSLTKASIAKARSLLDGATKHDPDYGEAWAALGVTQALSGDTKAAWKSLAKATALGFGHHPTAALGASFVRMRQGRFEDAAKILSDAVARHPGFMHARGYLGELYNHRGQHREALKVFTQYSERVPSQPWVLAQRGYTKAKLRDHIGAIADTIDAVDILPDSPSLLLQLASRYVDADKLIGAEDALLHALKKHPNDARVQVRLGYVYLLQGKDDLAIPITEKALADSGFGKNLRDKGYAHLNLVRAYGHKGDVERAIEHLARAQETGVSVDEIEGDRKLEGLRKEPRYKKLLQ